MENIQIYRKKRDFDICNIVGVCATTRKQFVDEVFHMPTHPVSATVKLVGIPAVISAKENPKVAEMYSKATMVAIDGMPIVKLARSKGFDCERCAAPDIMGLVFEESIKQRKTHYFYGGKDKDVLEKLRLNLDRNYPGIQIVGMYSPPFRSLTDEEDKEICETINNANPNFVWVGIGAPKQEMWMLQHQERINNCVMLGVGAGFNFYAGTLDKAPEWMEKCSLEWFYRLIKEPRRLWRRYILGGFKFMYYLAESKVGGLKELIKSNSSLSR